MSNYFNVPSFGFDIDALEKIENEETYTLEDLKNDLEELSKAFKSIAK